MNQKQINELADTRAEIVTNATKMIMSEYVNTMMKLYGVTDQRTGKYCEHQVFHQLWRALDEAEWAVSERAMV